MYSKFGTETKETRKQRSPRRSPPHLRKGVTAGVLSDVKMYTKMEQLEHLGGGGGGVRRVGLWCGTVGGAGNGGWLND